MVLGTDPVLLSLHGPQDMGQLDIFPDVSSVGRTPDLPGRWLGGDCYTSAQRRLSVVGVMETSWHVM